MTERWPGELREEPLAEDDPLEEPEGLEAVAGTDGVVTAQAESSRHPEAQPAEHAAASLDIPDDVDVLEGEAGPIRRDRDLEVQRRGHYEAARVGTRRARPLGGRPRTDRRRTRSRRVRASAGGDGAREDAALRVRRRARLRDPRRDAALRLRRVRGRKRPSACRARDRSAGRVRCVDDGERGAGRGTNREGRRGRPYGARDGRPVRAPAALGGAADVASARPRLHWPPPCRRSAQSAARSRRLETTEATRWSRRGVGSTRTSSAFACSWTGRRRAPTSAPAV